MYACISRSMTRTGTWFLTRIAFWTIDASIIFRSHPNQTLITDTDIFPDQTVSELGRGAFGQVFKCKDLYNAQLCAVKVIRRNEDSESEVQVLHTLRPNDPDNK